MQSPDPARLLSLCLCQYLFSSSGRFLGSSFFLFWSCLRGAWTRSFLRHLCWALGFGRSCPSVLENVGGTVSVVTHFPLVSIFFSLLFFWNFFYLMWELLDCFSNFLIHSLSFWYFCIFLLFGIFCQFSISCSLYCPPPRHFSYHVFPSQKLFLVSLDVPFN